MKNKIRVGLIIVAIIIIIANWTFIDYSNSTLFKHLAPYIATIVMISYIISAIIQIRHDKKKQANLTDMSR